MSSRLRLIEIATRDAVFSNKDLMDVILSFCALKTVVSLRGVSREMVVQTLLHRSEVYWKLMANKDLVLAHRQHFDFFRKQVHHWEESSNAGLERFVREEAEKGVDIEDEAELLLVKKRWFVVHGVHAEKRVQEAERECMISMANSQALLGPLRALV